MDYTDQATCMLRQHGTQISSEHGVRHFYCLRGGVVLQDTPLIYLLGNVMQKDSKIYAGAVASSTLSPWRY